jgi:tryptophan-rich sensory protein
VTKLALLSPTRPRPTLPRAPILVAGVATVAVLGAGGVLTGMGFGPWYERLRKPSWQPPGWLFGPAWSTIGVLTATSAVIAWDRAKSREDRTRIVGTFAANGSLNAGWSGLFFALRRPDWALAEVVPLWVSVAGMIRAVAPVSRRAAWLLAPYLAWVSFAAVLNGEIVRLNAPFGQRDEGEATITGHGG